MLVLTVAKGPDRGKVFELRGLSRAIIGRNSPDLKLNDIMISRYHAKLKRDGDRWLVRDLGSRNGTRLNGDRLMQVAILKTGDHIVTGYTEFEVSFAPDPSDAPALEAAAPQTEDESDIEIQGAASSSPIDADAGDDPIELDDPKPSTIPSDQDSPLSTASIRRLPDDHLEDASGEAGHVAPPPAANPIQEDVADVHEVTEVEVAAHETDEPEHAAQAAVDDETVKPATISGQDEEIIAQPFAAANQPESAESGMLNLGPIADSIIAENQSGPVSAQQQGGDQAAPLTERAASEWMSAIESQLVAAEGQGWEDLTDEEDDGFLDAGIEEVEPLEDHERSLLYFDEDDHWADDVQPDDDEMVRALEEDGPEALLKDLQIKPAGSLVEKPAKTTGKGRKRKRRG